MSVDSVRDGKTAGGPGRYTNTGHGTGGVALADPQAYGGGAGCWVIAGTWPPPGGSCSPSSMALRVGTPSPLVLCGGSSSSVALCVGSPSPMALRVGTPSLVALCAGSPSLVALCAGSPSLVALCAGSTSPSCLCVGTGLGCRSTSSCSVASACFGRCVPGRVLLRSVRVSFSVSRHSLVSLCSLKRIFRYPLFTADCVRVFSRFVGPWGLEVEPSMVSVTSPSEPVSIGVRASWLGFVGGLFPRFCLTFVSVLGFPHVLSPVWVALSGSCPGSISTLSPTWQFFCSVTRWSFVVRWGALTCGCLRWPACWLPCNSLHAVMGYG